MCVALALYIYVSEWMWKMFHVAEPANTGSASWHEMPVAWEYWFSTYGKRFWRRLYRVVLDAWRELRRKVCNFQCFFYCCSFWTNLVLMLFIPNRIFIAIHFSVSSTGYFWYIRKRRLEISDVEQISEIVILAKIKSWWILQFEFDF